MKSGGCIYIITNVTHTVLYIGVTSNLIKRIYEHKHKIFSNSFTNKYNCTKLVYYKFYSRMEEAILQEKKLKNWHREWKINLINEFNPYWNDLYDSLSD